MFRGYNDSLQQRSPHQPRTSGGPAVPRSPLGSSSSPLRPKFASFSDTPSHIPAGTAPKRLSSGEPSDRVPKVAEAQRRSLVTSFQEDVAVRPGNSGERERAPPKFQFDAPPALRVSEYDLKDVRSPAASPRIRPDSPKHEPAARPPASEAAPTSNPAAARPAPRVRVRDVSPDVASSATTQARTAGRLRDLLRKKCFDAAKPGEAANAPLHRLHAAIHACVRDKRGMDMIQFQRAMKQMLSTAGSSTSAREARMLDEDFQDIFRDIDTDATGRVSVNEVFAYLAFDEPELRALSQRVVRAVLPTGASSSDAQVQAALAAFRTTEEKLDATALKQAISKLGVAVTSQEAMSLFDYIDQDHSRYITADELKEWITLCLGSSVASGADGAATTASSYSTTQCVVDMLLSTTAEEEVALRARGYKRLEPSLNLGNLGSPVHLWVLKMSEASLISGKTPADAAVLLSAFAANRITDILASRKIEDAGLACDGFQRLAHSVNAGTWFASSMYLWLRRNSAKPADAFPILDVTIVVGDGAPSQRGYRLVEGNLNSGTVGKSLHLWYLKESYDTNAYDPQPARTPIILKRALEQRMRSMLRQYAKQLSLASAPAGTVPTTLDFETVFKHLAGPPATSTASKKKKKQKASVSKLTRDAFLKVISLELGLHIPKAYQEFLWTKLDANGDGVVLLPEFEQYVSFDPTEMAAKVNEVLDALLWSLDEGMSLQQLLGPFAVLTPAGPMSRGSWRPEDEVCITEDALAQALPRMRVAVSLQERSKLFAALGFGDDGMLPQATLTAALDVRRAKKTRVSKAIAKLRAFLTAAATPSPAAATARASTRRGPRDLVRSNINFEAAWKSLSPVKAGRIFVLTQPGLEAALYGPVGILPSELLTSEVEDVMAAVAASSGEPLCSVATSASPPPAPSGAPLPVTHQLVKALSFSHLCSFLSPDEIAADRAVGRLVDLLRAAKQSPMQFFDSMDSDRSGNVAPAELRRALNDAIAAVNDESYQSGSADALGSPPEFQFFSQNDAVALIKRFDRDGDGSLNLQEFLAFVKQFVPEVVKEAPAPTVLFARAIYTSFSKDQEATFHRRGFVPVPGDISNGTGVSEVKLWLEVETAPSSDAANKEPDISNDAIVSVCVVPANPSRAMLDALISKRFMRAAVLTEGCTLWCLTKADLPADTTHAATCVTQLAISYLITKSTGGPPVHTPPSTDVKWICAGKLVSGSGGSVGIWQFGGVPNHLDEVLHPVVSSSLSTAADSTVVPVPDRAAASSSSSSLSDGFVDVLVVACKDLIGVSYLERAQCSVSLHTHAVNGASAETCSTELTTSFASITNSVASWLTLSTPTVDASAPIVQSLKLRLRFDTSKLRKPTGSKDTSLDLTICVSGATGTAVVPISTMTAPLTWYEQNPRVARLEWFNLTDARNAPAGQIQLWACFYPDATVTLPIASLGYAADPTTVVTTAKQSTSGRRARHLVDSDDESIESAAASIGVVRVSVLEATARTPFPEAARLTTSTHAVLAGETVCAPSLQSESSPEGMYKHSWKSSTTRQCNISVKADWKERGRIVVEVFGANMQPVARAADAWSDDDELTGPSSVNTSLGSVKFAIRDVVSSDQQPITEWYTLRRSPSSGKHVFGPIEVLVRLEFVTSKQRTQPSTSLNSLVSIVRDSLSRRPGGVTALQTSLHSNSKGGRITARDLDRSLKAVDASLPIDQLKQLARALLREERVGSGFSDDDDGLSELDIKIRGDTLVNFLPLLKLLQPASVSNAEGVHSSSTAAAQIDRLQLPDRSSEVAAVESKSLTDATSSVISAFRSVCGGDASKSPIASALAARDRDGTGYVSVDDVCTVMAQHNVFVDRVSASAAIRQQGIHIDQYDKLNYKQLLSQLNSGASTGLSTAELALRKRIRESAWFGDNYLHFREPFAAADIHNHGRLTLQDFQDAVGRLGVPMSQQELVAIAKRLDVNADGLIDYYEFSKLIDLETTEINQIGNRLSTYISSTSGKLAAVTEALSKYERPIPGSASASTVTSSDFHRVLSYSGLPVSAVEIALLARLFTAPDLTIDHARFLQFASTGVLSPSSLPVSFDRPHTQARPSSAIARTTSNAGLLDLLQKLPPEQHAVATMVAQALGVEASAAAAHTSRPASVASPPRHSFGSASAHPQQHASKHHRQHSSISFASTVEDAPVEATLVYPFAPERSHPESANAAVNTTSSLFKSDKREQYKRHGIWSCPMCYFTQTSPWRTTCAMCAGSNPYADDDYAVKWQCSACSYLNQEGAERCRMCGLHIRGAALDQSSSASFEMKPASPHRSTYAGSGTPMTSPMLDRHPSPRRASHALQSQSAADVGVHLAMMPDGGTRGVPRPSSGFASQRTPIPTEASLSHTLPRNYGSSSLMASPQVPLPGQPSHAAWSSSGPGVHASFHQRVVSAGSVRQSYPAAKDAYTTSAAERWNIGGRTLQFS